MMSSTVRTANGECQSLEGFSSPQPSPIVTAAWTGAPRRLRHTRTTPGWPGSPPGSHCEVSHVSNGPTSWYTAAAGAPAASMTDPKQFVSLPDGNVPARNRALGSTPPDARQVSSPTSRCRLGSLWAETTLDRICSLRPSSSDGHQTNLWPSAEPRRRVPSRRSCQPRTVGTAPRRRATCSRTSLALVRFGRLSNRSSEIQSTAESLSTPHHSRYVSSSSAVMTPPSSLHSRHCAGDSTRNGCGSGASHRTHDSMSGVGTSIPSTSGTSACWQRDPSRSSTMSEPKTSGARGRLRWNEQR